MSAHNILSQLSDATTSAGKPIVVIGSGEPVPSGVPGYAKGCILIKPGDNAYLNDGTESSCAFKAISHAN